MGSPNKLPLWLRWSGLALGAVTFLWFPIEDTNTAVLTVLALLWSGWGVAWWGIRRPATVSSGGRAAAAGALAGLLSLPAGLLLVIIKAGLHAHGFLDFSTTQMGNFATRTPLWAVVGALVGWLVYRLILSRENPSTRE